MKTMKYLQSRATGRMAYGPFDTWRQAREFRHRFDPSGQRYRITRSDKREGP